MITTYRDVVEPDRWHADLGGRRAVVGAASEAQAREWCLGLLEHHRPVQRPYEGAPGFHLAQCRVCDAGFIKANAGRERWTVRKDGSAPYRCAVWAEAVAAGLVAVGSRGTSSVG